MGRLSANPIQTVYLSKIHHLSANPIQTLFLGGNFGYTKGGTLCYVENTTFGAPISSTSPQNMVIFGNTPFSSTSPQNTRFSSFLATKMSDFVFLGSQILSTSFLRWHISCAQNNTHNIRAQTNNHVHRRCYPLFDEYREIQWKQENTLFSRMSCRTPDFMDIVKTVKTRKNTFLQSTRHEHVFTMKWGTQTKHWFIGYSA